MVKRSRWLGIVPCSLWDRNWSFSENSGHLSLCNLSECWGMSWVQKLLRKVQTKCHWILFGSRDAGRGVLLQCETWGTAFNEFNVYLSFKLAPSPHGNSCGNIRSIFWAKTGHKKKRSQKPARLTFCCGYWCCPWCVPTEENSLVYLSDTLWSYDMIGKTWKD